MRLVGWWHPNVNAGRVHDHPDKPGGSWSVASHRLCDQVAVVTETEAAVTDPPTVEP